MQYLDLPQHPLPGVRDVLILTQESRASRVFGDAVAGHLTGEPPGRNPRLPLVAEGISVPIKVTRGTVTGTPDAATVRRLAKEHGAALVAMGSAEGVQESYDQTTEKRERTVKTSNGEKKVSFDVSCAERVVRVDYEWTLFDGAAGEVLFQDSGSSTRKSKDCDEDAADNEDTLAVATVSELADPAVDGYALTYVRSFRPEYHTFTYPIDADRRSKDAVAALSAGSWTTAASAIAAGLEASPFDHEQICYAAIAMLAAGRYAEATDLLALAQRYARRDSYAKLAVAVSDRATTAGQLVALYGVTATPLALPELDGLVQRARAILGTPTPGGDELVVRPLLRPDVDLLAEPTKKATTVAVIPEWTRVYRVAVEGDLVQVVLPDGSTRGWVKKNNLKSP